VGVERLRFKIWILTPFPARLRPSLSVFIGEVLPQMQRWKIQRRI